jgi:intracellular sulfur oxidation DsrE/DsrF family protein
VGDKLLIHISDRDKWQSLCHLIMAYQDSPGGQDLHIVVVADIFAGGVCLACSKALRDNLEALVDRGHRILVCQDSLKSLNLRNTGLPEFMEAIPNSLGEISKLRAEGFQYVKV